MPEAPKAAPYAPATLTGLEAGLFGDWGLAIRLKAGCVNKCMFCHGYREAVRPTSRAEVEALLSQRPPGPVFFFGEVLTHPGLLELLDAALARGAAPIELQATPEELADEALVKELASRARSVSIAVYGVGPLHDRLVGRPGAWKLVEKAFENLSKERRLKTWLHTVLMKPNLEHVGRLAALARERGFPFSVLPLDPKTEVPGIEKLQCSLEEFAARYEGSGLNLVGFPLCVVRRVNPPLFEKLSSGPAPEPSVWKVPEGVSDVTFGYTRIFRTERPAECSACPVKERCPGTFSRYLERFGAEGLRPIPAGAAR